MYYNQCSNAFTYSTEAFSYDATSKLFVTDASDLQPYRDGGLFGRIYSDACDVGIFLVSHHTGRVAAYHVCREDMDEHGDLVAWYLEPTTESVRNNPNLAGTRITIFND